MYGKLFESMYDGTLVEDWRALVTFQQMIILCGADGIIDMTPSALSRRTGIPIEHIKAGIEILQNIDPYSRTQTDEGRRIMLIDEHRPWGWHIVNHNKYKHLQDADTVRTQTRERVKKHRAMKRSVTVGNGRKRHTDTDTDIKHMSNSSELDFTEFWKIYPKKESKKKAKQRWDRLTKSNKQKALEDLKDRFIDTKKEFIPLPTSYINAERWNDELTTDEKSYNLGAI